MWSLAILSEASRKKILNCYIGIKHEIYTCQKSLLIYWNLLIDKMQFKGPYIRYTTTIIHSRPLILLLARHWSESILVISYISSIKSGSEYRAAHTHPTHNNCFIISVGRWHWLQNYFTVLIAKWIKSINESWHKHLKYLLH